MRKYTMAVSFMSHRFVEDNQNLTLIADVEVLVHIMYQTGQKVGSCVTQEMP